MFSNTYRQELQSRHYCFATLAAIYCGVIIFRDILTPWIRFTSDMSVTSTNLYKVRPRLPDYFLPSSLRSSARSRYALACDLPYLIDCFGNRLGGRLPLTGKEPVVEDEILSSRIGDEIRSEGDEKRKIRPDTKLMFEGSPVEYRSPRKFLAKDSKTPSEETEALAFLNHLKGSATLGNSIFTKDFKIQGLIGDPSMVDEKKALRLHIPVLSAFGR